MVERGEHANEALPADAASKSRRPLRLRPSLSAASLQDRQGTGGSRQSSGVQPLFPWQDCVCHGQSGHERADDGSCYGLEERRQRRNGDLQYLASSRK